VNTIHILREIFNWILLQQNSHYPGHCKGEDAPITEKNRKCRMFCLSFHKIWQFTLLAFYTTDVYLEKHSLVVTCFCELFTIQQLPCHCIPTLFHPCNQANCQHTQTSCLNWQAHYFLLLVHCHSPHPFLTILFVTALTISTFVLQQVQFTHVALMKWYQLSDTIICSTGLPTYLLTK